MGTESDRELVEHARRGDMRAFGELARRHQPRLCRLAAQLLRDEAEAEDIAQEAFVRAYRALSAFDGRSEPFTWLYRITVNLCLNTLRSRKVRRASSTEDVEDELVEQRPLHSDPSARSADTQLAQVLLAGMDALSETLRTTLILVCVDGLSHAEAGEVLGCPEGTVAWRVHEARRRLRAWLDKHGYAGEVS